MRVDILSAFGLENRDAYSVDFDDENTVVYNQFITWTLKRSLGVDW